MLIEIGGLMAIWNSFKKQEPDYFQFNIYRFIYNDVLDHENHGEENPQMEELQMCVDSGQKKISNQINNIV